MTNNANKFKPNRKLYDTDTYTENTSNRYITITEDKLEIYANKFADGVKAKVYWTAPMGIFLTLLVTVLTVDFKEIGSLSSDTWRNIFWVATVVAGIFTVTNCIKYCQYLGDADIDKFKQDIRGDNN